MIPFGRWLGLGIWLGEVDERGYLCMLFPLWSPLFVVELKGLGGWGVV